MAFTGQLGIADSYLANIELAVVGGGGTLPPGFTAGFNAGSVFAFGVDARAGVNVGSAFDPLIPASTGINVGTASDFKVIQPPAGWFTAGANVGSLFAFLPTPLTAGFAAAATFAVPPRDLNFGAFVATIFAGSVTPAAPPPPCPYRPPTEDQSDATRAKPDAGDATRTKPDLGDQTRGRTDLGDQTRPKPDMTDQTRLRPDECR